MIPGPLHSFCPPRVTTNGDLAAGVGDDLGLAMDPQQRWFLDAIYAEDADGLPCSGDVAIVGPRQTVGKTATLEVAAIADVTIFGAPLHVWTAHEFRTARKSYQDMRQRLEGHPDYSDRVTFRDAHGEEAIFFDSGGVIEFHSRSGGSGRGFTTSRITLDEALFLAPGDLGALVPTGVTMPDFQVRYGSSGGKPKSAVLREIRDRGRSPDVSESLAYLEFGATRRECEDSTCAHGLALDGCALNDRSLWWQANSGMWYGRVTEDAMLKQRRMLSGVPEEFAREFLTWWDDPTSTSAAFGVGNWEACARERPAGVKPTGLGLAVSMDSSRCALVAAGGGHVMPLQHGPGTLWAVDRAKTEARLWNLPVVIDGRGPGAPLIPHLEAAGVTVHEASTPEVFDACAGIDQAVRSRLLGHGTYPELDSAVAAAVRRESGDRWAWGRRASTSDISPLEAATLAWWYATRPIQAAPPTLVWGRRR